MASTSPHSLHSITRLSSCFISSTKSTRFCFRAFSALRRAFSMISTCLSKTGSRRPSQVKRSEFASISGSVNVLLVIMNSMRLRAS